MMVTFPATSIFKLEDQYLVLVSGEAESTSMVYAYHVAPLDAEGDEIGAIIRKGLAGDRRLSNAEEKKYAKQLATDKLMADLDDWNEKFPSVTIIGGTKMYELRVLLAGSRKYQTLEVSASSSDKKLGDAVTRLLESAGAKKTLIRSR